MSDFNIQEPKVNLAPLRRSFFSREFWELWDQMMEKDRAAYTLGCIAELEAAIGRMDRRIERLEQEEEP